MSSNPFAALSEDKPVKKVAPVAAPAPTPAPQKSNNNNNNNRRPNNNNNRGPKKDEASKDGEDGKSRDNRRRKPRGKGAESKDRHSRGPRGSGAKDDSKRGGGRRGDWGKTDGTDDSPKPAAAADGAAPAATEGEAGTPEEPVKTPEPEEVTMTLAEYKKKNAAAAVEAPVVRELSSEDAKFKNVLVRDDAVSDVDFHDKTKRERIRKEKQTLETGVFYPQQQQENRRNDNRRGGRRNNRNQNKKSAAPDVLDDSAFPSL